MVRQIMDNFQVLTSQIIQYIHFIGNMVQCGGLH